jgi:steroid 5-alpha reductase family enzyme
MPKTLATDDLETRARRRVHRKVGFYVHALVFVIVNLGLYAINSATGAARWSQFPLWGWGLGLTIHGIVTFIALQGDGLHQSMVQREMEHLRRNEPR